MSETVQSITAIFLVSGLSFVGAFTLLFKDAFLKKIIAFLVALSVGALFGDAFIHLLPKAFEVGSRPLYVSVAVSLGVLVFFLIEKVLLWRHSHGRDEESADTLASHDHSSKHDRKHVGWLVFIGDGVHNLIDGVIIAAGFLAGPDIGIATTLAVALHEIPQEFGDFGLLLHAGWTKGRALFMNFVSALTAFLGAAIVLVFQSSLSEGILALCSAFAAGGFIYIAGSDLVPELHEKTDRRAVISQVISVTLGFALMFALVFVE